MPILRALTDDEKEELKAQGVVDIPAQVEVLSPEEVKQEQLQKTAPGGRLAAAGTTLAAHGGSIVGGGLGGLGGWGLGAALAPETGGLSFAIPLITSLIGGFGGSKAGQGLQRAIVPSSVQQPLEERAEAYHERFPFTTTGTEIAAGALAGGGKPTLRAPLYAARGLKEGLENEGLRAAALTGSTSPIYKQAVQNVLTGGALNTAINAGMQYATTGEINPIELGGAAIAGTMFSEPSRLGTKFNKHWQPLARVSGVQNAVAEGITPTGENIADVQAYRAKAKASVDAMTEGLSGQLEQDQAQEEAYNKMQHDFVQQQQDFQTMNWLTPDPSNPNKYFIGDKAVKKEFVKRFSKAVPEGETRPEVIQYTKAQNSMLGRLGVDQMRQELYEQDFSTRDPQGYQQYKQAQADKAAADSEKLQQLKANIAEQNRRQQAEQEMEQRRQDFLAAQEERQQQEALEAQRQATAKRQQEAEAWKQRQAQKAAQEKGVITQNQQRIINTKGIAEGMMKKGLAQPKEGGHLFQQVSEEGETPYPFTYKQLLKGENVLNDLAQQTIDNPVEENLRKAEAIQDIDDKSQNILNQEAGQKPSDMTDEEYQRFLREAGKMNVEVGEIKEGELRTPEGKLAAGVAYNPALVGRRLIGLAREVATSDTGYHELVHTMLRDLDNSPAPRHKELAAQIREAFGGEEPTAQIGGERAFANVEKLAKSGRLGRLSEYFKNVWAATKVGYGNPSRENLMRNLLARMSNRHGEQDILNSQESGTQGQINQPGYFNYRNAWVDSDGNIHYVSSHLAGGQKILGENIAPGETGMIYKKMFEKGYVRMVEASDEISFEGNPNPKQLKMLKDKAIEEKKLLIKDNYTRGPAQTIYSPEDQFQPAKVTYRVTVSPEQQNIKGTGYVQVDEFNTKGENVRSTNPEKLRSEGIDIPTTEELMKLPMGRYGLEAAKFALKNATGGNKFQEVKFSKPLEDEIKYVQDSFNESADEGETLSREEAIKRIMEDSDEPNHPAHNFYNELNDYAIKAGIYKEMSKQELDNTQVTSGHKYDLKKNGKFYRFDSWEPLIGKEEGNQYQAAKEERQPLSLPLFRSEIQKVARVSPEIGKSFTKFYEKFTRLRGELTNDVVGQLRRHLTLTNPRELFTQNNSDMQAVTNYLKDMFYNNGESNIKLTPEQKQIEGIVRQNLKKSLALKNTYPGLPKTEAPNENYLPLMPSRKVLDTILNKSPEDPARQKLIKDFLDYHINEREDTPEEARKALEVFTSGYNKQKVDLAQQFGPIDKSAGVSIPRSWTEDNLMDIMSRFNNRYARRIAYHDAIEQNPEAMKLLEDPVEGVGGNESVKAVLNDISGQMEFNEAKRMAVSGLIRAAMLGPLTGGKDFVSNLVLGFQHQSPGQALTSAFHSWANMRDNIAESFKAGVNRYNIGSLEFGEGGLSDVINLLRRSRDVMNAVQGRNFLEQMTRATAFGQGKWLAMDNLFAARENRLSTQGRKFLNDFAPEWKDYVSKGEFPTEMLQDIASRYVESVQGTYDYRGLPAIAQRGSLAPYLSLARWNIEKTNNFIKYNIDPLVKGNPLPLLMSTIGMFAGGSVLTKLVEEATNKKQKTPEWREIQAASEQGYDVKAPVVWKLASLASLSGYLGMIGDLTKSLMDVEFKNRPQTWDNPLLTGLSEVANNVWDVVEAAQSGDLEVTADALGSFLEDTTQVYRLALNNLSPEKKQQLEKTDKYRDLRVFKQLSNQDVSEVGTEKPNPFIGGEAKKFKQTPDLNEARDLLPSLIAKALKKSNGDIERLRAELDKLKRNSYQTMPNPESMPAAFLRNLEFLRKTQGETVASQRLADYIQQNAVNSLKTEMVP